MQSMRSFFNRTIFAKTVRRYWPMWLMYLLVMAFALGVCTRSSCRYYSFDRSFSHDDLLEFTWMFGLFASGIIACISAMLVHSWMYNSRSASAYSALPICRGSMYISVTMAGLIPILLCNFAAALTALFVALFNGYFIPVTALFCFLALSLEYIFFYGLATLCATLTGHVFVLPAVYLIFNFVVVVIEYLSMALMSYFTFGATFGAPKLEAFSPAFYLYRNLNVSNPYTEIVAGGFVERSFATFDSWWPLIIYAAIGVLLVSLGSLVFRKRKMESASDVVAVPLLKPVFKYCLCFGCALVIGLVLYAILFDAFFYGGVPASGLIVCLCMLFGGFIGYFAAEMLLKKSFKVFKAWKGFLVSCAVIILFITAIETDLFGYERRIPDSDRIASAHIRIWGEPTGFTDAADISEVTLLHERIINSKNETEKDIRRYYTGYDYRDDENIYPYNVYIIYLLDNGSYVERDYTLIYRAEDKFCSDMMNMLNRPASIHSRIDSSIDLENLYSATIYYNYTVPVDTYLGEGEEYYEYYLKEGVADYAISGATDRLPVPGDVNISRSVDKEYIHGDLQLTAQEAKELYHGAIAKDINAGNIARILPSDEHYKDRIDINIEFSSRIPREPNDPNEGFFYEYIFLNDVTDDAVHTIAALKELGIDFEALASSALEW